MTTMKMTLKTTTTYINNCRHIAVQNTYAIHKKYKNLISKIPVFIF